MDEETIKLGVNATPQFIGALTEMVWTQIGMYIPLFCLVMLRDVKCCFRRSSRRDNFIAIASTLVQTTA